MRYRQTFFIPRESLLHRLTPLSKLTFVASIIVLDFFGPGYWLPTVLFVLLAVIAWRGARLGGAYRRATVRLLLPVFIFLFVMQSFFYPGGRTVLLQVWIFSLTAEGLRFAYLTVSRIMVMVASFVLFLLTTHPSRLMDDLRQRGFPGPLSYVVTSTMQILPLMGSKAGRIVEAQRARGLDTEGGFRKRAAALLPLIGPLVFGSLAEVEERAIAIEARGFNAPAKKTTLLPFHESKAEVRSRGVAMIFVGLVLLSRLWLS